MAMTSVATRPDRFFHKNFKPSKFEDELALVALVVAAILAVLFFKSIPMAGLFLGFYAGFFLFKEMELKQTALQRKTLVWKYLFGFAVLGALVLIGEDIGTTGSGVA